MADSQNGSLCSQPEPKGLPNQSISAEDEIDLIDYLMVLWRRKYFIVFGTAIPTLIVGLILLFLPNRYKVTYTYDFGLDEKASKALLDYFYGIENWGLLTARLKETGPGVPAEAISPTGVKLELSGTSLLLSVGGDSSESVQRISSVVRDNIENVLPMYTVKKKLSNAIVEFRTKIADIEENKFDIELELQKKKAILAKLKALELGEFNEPSNIILHFEDVHQNGKYLPLVYQIQATDVNIVNIEETIAANQKKCDYYNTLQNLNERLLKEINTKATCTVEDFRSFLANGMNENGNAGTKDYLIAYVERIENMVAVTKPIVGKPEISAVPKSVITKTAMTCVVLLVAAILSAFLLENVLRKQVQVT